MKFWMIILIVLAVVLVGLVILYFLGRRMQKKQAENRAQVEAMAQTTSMLIIDKKYMKLSEANLPKIL